MTTKFKIMFVHTEGWFFLSHFKPLSRAAGKVTDQPATIVTNAGANRDELEQLGLEISDLDFNRSSLNPFSLIAVSMQLRAIIRQTRPDIVHFVALKPMLAGGLACAALPRTSRVFHVTGMGHLAEGNSLLARVRRTLAFRLLSLFINHPKAWLCAENPDDLNFLARYGARTERRTTLLGGAGVDPTHFTPRPHEQQTSGTSPLKVAYVGRMIRSKGVDVLIRACDLLTKQAPQITIDLYGMPDPSNPKALTEREIRAWTEKKGITWHGRTNDVRMVWEKCEVCVVPTPTREGMPRAMLEAAACGRALIVTDVPGCRHFVRHGVEGLIIPPGDAQALAEALQTLADNPELRTRMGHAARERILQGYTEEHLVERVAAIYQHLLHEDAKRPRSV